MYSGWETLIIALKRLQSKMSILYSRRNDSLISLNETNLSARESSDSSSTNFRRDSYSFLHLTRCWTIKIFMLKDLMLVYLDGQIAYFSNKSIPTLSPFRIMKWPSMSSVLITGLYLHSFLLKLK